MKILNTVRQVVSKLYIEDDCDTYIRTEYADGKVMWTPHSYDGECEEETLEMRYKLLLKDKVVDKKIDSTKPDNEILTVNFEDFLKKIKVRSKPGTNWFSDGYKTIKFRNSLTMDHKKLGEFAWIFLDEIELKIPLQYLKTLINKPVETK